MNGKRSCCGAVKMAPCRNKSLIDKLKASTIKKGKSNLRNNGWVTKLSAMWQGWCHRDSLLSHVCLSVCNCVNTRTWICGTTTNNMTFIVVSVSLTWHTFYPAHVDTKYYYCSSKNNVITIQIAWLVAWFL